MESPDRREKQLDLQNEHRPFPLGPRVRASTCGWRIPMTDAELLGEAMRGNEKAFCELYKRYRDPLFRYAYRLTRSVPVAEDIVHDCFVSMMEHGERYDSRRARLVTYLFGVVRNLAAKHIAKAGRECASENASQLAPAHEVTDNSLLRCEASQQVQRAVQALPQLQREVLILRDFEGLPLGQIAGIVEANLGTVKARLHRARENLRKSLKDYVKGKAEVR